MTNFGRFAVGQLSTQLLPFQRLSGDPESRPAAFHRRRGLRRHRRTAWPGWIAAIANPALSCCRNRAGNRAMKSALLIVAILLASSPAPAQRGKRMRPAWMVGAWETLAEGEYLGRAICDTKELTRFEADGSYSVEGEWRSKGLWWIEGDRLVTIETDPPEGEVASNGERPIRSAFAGWLTAKSITPLLARECGWCAVRVRSEPLRPCPQLGRLQPGSYSCRNPPVASHAAARRRVALRRLGPFG